MMPLNGNKKHLSFDTIALTDTSSTMYSTNYMNNSFEINNNDNFTWRNERKTGIQFLSYE